MDASCEKKAGDSPASTTTPSFFTALVAGGMAGTSVDVALFPIDTLKTRLQAPGGFAKAGGFRGVYNGIGAAAAGSAPGAALFFGTYETMKPIVGRILHGSGIIGNEQDDGEGSGAAVTHMLAASMGEAVACLVRVPTEVVKARMQVASGSQKLSLTETVRSVLAETHGGSPLSHLTGGLFRGYSITLFREIPFAMIQFPLYEKLKVIWAQQQDAPCSPLQAAACGSGSGAVAAALTTPLDVLKTRLMLGRDSSGKAYTGVWNVLQSTVAAEGSGALFNGVQPRVLWITIGGFVFFGAYESAQKVVSPVLG